MSSDIPIYIIWVICGMSSGVLGMSSDVLYIWGMCGYLMVSL